MRNEDIKHNKQLKLERKRRKELRDRKRTPVPKEKGK